MKALLCSLTIALFLFLPLQSVLGEELFDTKASDEHFQKGLKYCYQESFKSAIGEFKKAILINPDNAKAHYYLGYTYYKMGDFNQALKGFEMAYEINNAYTPILPPLDFPPLPHSF